MAKNKKKVVKKKSRWAPVLIAVIFLFVVILGTWLVYTKLNYEKRLAAFLRTHALSAENLQFDWLGNYRLSNVSVEEAEPGNFVIGDVRGHMSLFSDKMSLQASDIRYGLASVEIFIPELEMEQATIHRVSAATPAQPLPLARLLAAAEVKRIVIPELYVRPHAADSQQGRDAQSVVFRDIELQDIMSGNISMLSGRTVELAAASDITKADDGQPPLARLAAGPFAIHDISAALWSGFPPAAGDSNNAEPVNHRLLGRYNIKNIVSQPLSEKGPANYHIEELSGSGLLLSSAYGQTDGNSKADGGLRKPVLDINAAPFTLLKALGPLDLGIKGFTFGSSEHMSTSFDNGHFSYNGESMDFAFDNIRVALHDVKARLASLELQKVRFPQLLDVVNEFSKVPVNQQVLERLEWRMRFAFAVMPRFAYIKLAGLNVDKEGEAALAPVLAVETFDITAGHERGAMPTSLRVDISHMHLPVSFFEGRGFEPSATEQSYLKKLGYQDYLDSNFVLDLKWDAAKQQVELNEFSSDIADLASFKLWGTIGHVDETFFMDNPFAMAISAAGFRIRDVHLRADKDGLWQRVIVRNAEQTGKSPEEIRSERIILVHNMLSRTASEDSETVKSLEPVFDYLNAGGVLRVDAVAKNPEGVGIYQFIFDPADPYRWLDYFNLKASRQDTGPAE